MRASRPLTDDRRFDAVLPLVGSDLDRALLLRETLELHGHAVRRVWVVAPTTDVATFQTVLGGDERWLVVDEHEIVPALAGVEREGARIRGLARWSAPEAGRLPLEGWYVQQLIKLAVAARVQTPVYLTLDADVLCVRPLHPHDVVDERGRAAAIGTGLHPNQHLYAHAERVLGVPATGITHGVTPALLNRAGVLDLLAHLERRAGAEGDEDWVSYLIRARPWSEYSLYSTWLESTGAYDTLHERRGPEALYGNCVWWPWGWPEWDVRRSFEGERRFFFTVVQSTAVVDAREVRERVVPFLERARGSDP
jgi:hypothetical protein